MRLTPQEWRCWAELHPVEDPGGPTRSWCPVEDDLVHALDVLRRLERLRARAHLVSVGEAPDTKTRVVSD